MVCPHCHEYAPPSPWIRIDSHPPPAHVFVLGLTTGGGVYQIIRSNSKDSFNGKITDWILPYYLRDDVIFTHWMYLPSLSEE